MNLGHQPPVHHRRTGLQSLVHTVAESHALHEREAVWKLQANLHSRDTVLCCRVRGSCPARGILVDASSIGLHPTTCQQAGHVIHDLLESLPMLWYGALGIGWWLKRCLILVIAPTVPDR